MKLYPITVIRSVNERYRPRRVLTFRRRLEYTSEELRREIKAIVWGLKK